MNHIVYKFKVIASNRMNYWTFLGKMNSRLDFLWRNKFKKENDELQVTSDMSRLLLENMLPKHVVEIIIDPKRNIDVSIFWCFFF